MPCVLSWRKGGVFCLPGCVWLQKSHNGAAIVLTWRQSSRWLLKVKWRQRAEMKTVFLVSVFKCGVLFSPSMFHFLTRRLSLLLSPLRTCSRSTVTRWECPPTESASRTGLGSPASVKSQCQMISTFEHAIQTLSCHVTAPLFCVIRKDSASPCISTTCWPRPYKEEVGDELLICQVIWRVQPNSVNRALSSSPNPFGDSGK